jgi:hemolysin III
MHSLIDLRRDGRPEYSVGEEIFHAVTHGVGIVLSIAGLAVLVAFASLRGGAAHVVGCSVFGACLVLLYTPSTLNHAIPQGKAKRVFQVLDHSGIYLLIAGTYTPFCLVTLGGAAGWTLFGVLWTLAIVGIVTRAVLPRLARRISLVLYLAMGWAILPVAGELLRELPTGGAVLVVLGGIAYTAGVPFYAARHLRWGHAVWHVFVMIGSLLHFFGVLLYVIPAP